MREDEQSMSSPLKNKSIIDLLRGKRDKKDKKSETVPSERKSDGAEEFKQSVTVLNESVGEIRDKISLFMGEIGEMK